ncbi:MAG: alpha/beta hydrolase [Bdellovibrio sp.]|nr:alpha/beta hydrolase [Bdellovibrio sp.]
MSKQWVLVRGIMSEAFHWGDFLPHLRAHFPTHQFHTADILGNGRQCKHTTPLSLNKNVQALREQAPAPGKKILLGFSLGGMLALEWAHRHPDEVEAVILINCSLNNSAIYKRLQPLSLKNIFQSAIQKDPLRREEIIIRLTTTALPADRVQQLAASWGPRVLEHPVKPINFLWQMFVAAQVTQRRTPPAPVLVLASEKDRVVHPDCSHKIAKKWDIPVIKHPAAGHDLTLEDPHWVLEQVQNFLKTK